MSSILTRKINARQMGIKMIYPSDTFVVSYPKSGNTWVRFIIANMLTEELVTMKSVHDFVPDIYTSADYINSYESPRFIKSHHPYFTKYPKIIYISRDYRDVVISYYHYQIGLSLFEGTISPDQTGNRIPVDGSSTPGAEIFRSASMASLNSPNMRHCMQVYFHLKRCKQQ